MDLALGLLLRKTSSTPEVVPGAAPALAKAGVGGCVGCFTQIHEVNVKMLHYIFRLAKQIYKSNL